MKTPFVAARPQGPRPAPSRRRLQIILLPAASMGLLAGPRARAQSFLTGLSQHRRVADGFANPTVLAFAPDGRIFVGEQGGPPRVVKNGGLLAAPFVGMRVSSGGERGLLGIALNPDFASNRYVYCYDTVPTGTGHNRTSRFTANGDVALAGLKAMHLEELFQLTAQQQLFCFSPRLP